MSTDQSIDVVAGIVRDSDRILITQRLADDAWGGYWEFPGGKVEEGESDVQALERELWEEIGVQTTTGELVWEMVHDYTSHRVRVRFYYSQIREGSPICRDVQALRWITRNEMVNFHFLPSNEPLLKKLIDEKI